MPLVILQFKNLFHLFEYVAITDKQSSANIDTRKLRLACEATEADIELAEQGFGAVRLRD